MPSRRDFLGETALLTVFDSTRVSALSDQYQYDSLGCLVAVEAICGPGPQK
ncbi:hypothetical protein TPR58_17235 [Sphingomonas sp. HF-S3]|uniref:Uncharacterized protein n=1 Tax=Sphingomonas rustica TaxID=3103142 RepID=A0ABV0BBH9_9SPHN